MIETNEECTVDRLCTSSEWKEMMKMDRNCNVVQESRLYKHILTHQVIFARFYLIQLWTRQEPKMNFLLIRQEEIRKYPVPRLIEEFIIENLLSL
jgi:A/G-specific adenine glycosylase